MQQVDERIDHAVEHCPACGTPLTGGWVHRRVQVIELPAPAPVRVTEHALWRRQCPSCHRRVLPPGPDAGIGRMGRCRFGPRLLFYGDLTRFLGGGRQAHVAGPGCEVQVGP